MIGKVKLVELNFGQFCLMFYLFLLDSSPYHARTRGAGVFYLQRGNVGSCVGSTYDRALTFSSNYLLCTLHATKTLDQKQKRSVRLRCISTINRCDSGSVSSYQRTRTNCAPFDGRYVRFEDLK